MNYRSTKQVAQLLRVSVTRLSRAVWAGRIDAPAKGPGGAFLWTPADIERASWALRHRSFQDPEEANETAASS